MEDQKAIADHGFVKFAVKLLHPQLKRLLLLTSLAALARDIKDSDGDTIHLINEMLHLASNDSALMLPIRAKSFIWKDYSLIEENVRSLRSENAGTEAMGQASQIVKRVPDWFSYGTPSEMAGDIVSLFKITSIKLVNDTEHVPA